VRIGLARDSRTVSTESMDTTLQLWISPPEYDALVARREAERQAARELDARLLAEWAIEDASELQIAA
jgi:hypothetical protein